jgi:hypothetical protein
MFVEEGLLGGEIISKTKNRIFIKNLFDEKWEIIHDKETRMKRGLELKYGDKVIVVGEKQEDFVFKAFAVKKIEGCAGCGVPREFLNKPQR